MNSIILAGGKGRRLGKPKASIMIGNLTLLQHMVRLLAPLSNHIIIVIAQNQPQPLFPPWMPGEFIRDIYPDKSVLGGIYSGLIASNEA